jgi:ABC-type sugar transport system ATPase subunit
MFQYQKLKEPLGTLVNEKKWNDAENRLKVKNSLSNVFCADCFESRAKSVEKCRENDKQKDATLWEKYNEALCKSEHARWVVEKLIMGFRPFSLEDRMRDENLSPFKTQRKKHRDGLKGKKDSPAHIDLCSYNDLRRINPDDMKYDSFLMLAIPMILKRIDEEDK